jgi:hypothetical protein
MRSFRTELAWERGCGNAENDHRMRLPRQLHRGVSPSARLTEAQLQQTGATTHLQFGLPEGGNWGISSSLPGVALVPGRIEISDE